MNPSSSRASRVVKVSRAVAVAALAGSLLGGPASASAAAVITLPAYPFWANQTMVVDPAFIQPYADDYCARAGANATAEDFFYGDLALHSIDQLGLELTAGLSDAESVEALLGNLYVSGYFGGIWLRDSLEDTTTTLVTPGASVVLNRRTLAGVTPSQADRAKRSSLQGDARDRLIFRTLAGVVGKQVDLALDGSAGAVLLANRSTLPSYLYVYGYNRGYLEVLLAYPPAGTPSQDGKLWCGDFLDCASPGIDLDVLEVYRPALSSLASPDNARWLGMNRIEDQYGVSSLEDGKAVWESILSESTVSTAAYDPLVDLSVGYLLVSEAAVLAGMTAWAENDVAAGRSGLLLQSGLSLWSGAYFMGLASSAPVGTSPTLVCEP